MASMWIKCVVYFCEPCANTWQKTKQKQQSWGCLRSKLLTWTKVRFISDVRKFVPTGLTRLTKKHSAIWSGAKVSVSDRMAPMFCAPRRMKLCYLVSGMSASRDDYGINYWRWTDLRSGLQPFRRPIGSRSRKWLRKECAIPSACANWPFCLSTPSWNQPPVCMRQRQRRQKGG